MFNDAEDGIPSMQSTWTELLLANPSRGIDCGVIMFEWNVTVFQCKARFKLFRVIF